MGIRLFRANKSIPGKNIIILLILIITHGVIMIHGGGILIGGEDSASVITIIPTPIIMAVTMVDTMAVSIMVEAMAVDMGDSWV